MKNMILMVLLGSMAAPALAAEKRIVTVGNDPGCFQLPNTGAQAAIIEAIKKGEEQCSYAILRDLKVSIRQVGGCNPSIATATFACLSDDANDVTP